MIYLDHAATSPMRRGALEEMRAALETVYGNASPSYPPAQAAKAELDRARTTLAETIGADWREIFFTSGGTESDNWALIGAAELLGPGRHIIVSAAEHHAVLHTCAYLESRGFPVSYLPVTEEGTAEPAALEKELREHPDTGLVSVMLANNEVGTIEPVRELVRTARREHPGILFHTDAVQAYGKLPVDVSDLGVDLLSVSAHKIGGPKGIGFLYVRKGTRIGALLHGGGQESGRRAGTENVPAAIGFAAAAREAFAGREAENQRIRELQAFFCEELRRELGLGAEGGPVWNGPAPGTEKRLASNVSISFPGYDQRTLLMNLDLAGICASGGSACTTGALEPSHVLLAMGKSRREAAGALRFTLGAENTEEELRRTVRTLKETLRRISGTGPAAEGTGGVSGEQA